MWAKGSVFMKKVLCVLLSIFILTSSTAVFAEKIIWTATDATNIRDTSATLNSHFYVEFTQADIDMGLDEYMKENFYPSSEDYFEFWEDGDEHTFLGDFKCLGVERWVSGYVYNLKPSTTYHYRIAGDKNIITFTTLPATSEPYMSTEAYKYKSGDVSYFRVYAINLEKGEDELLVALYKDGKCIDVKSISVAYYNTYLLSRKVTDFDYAKVFAWNKKTLKPLTTPQIFYNDDIEIR